MESSMAPKHDILSADDVLDLPVPDGLIGYELADGQLLPVTPASGIHGQLTVEMGRVLKNYVLATGLGGNVFTDAGFILGLRRDPQRMRGPDVSYVAQAKLDANPNRERLFRCAPDLAVEIDLTSGKKPQGQQRILDYLEAGTRLVWVIDPHARAATIYRPDGSARLLRGDETFDGEDVVPGFRLELGSLFG
jgi:Uma2 family endonuclease